jgi:hypothetical protein
MGPVLLVALGAAQSLAQPDGSLAAGDGPAENNRRSLSVSVGAEYSDNALRLDTAADPVSETKSYLQAVLGLSRASRAVLVSLDYFGEAADYDNKTTTEEAYWEGRSRLDVKGWDERVSWTFAHERSELLQNDRDVDIRNNQEARDVFRTGPTAKLRLRSTDNLVLNGEYSWVLFEDTENSDSERITGGIAWEHLRSKSDAYGLGYRYLEADFDGFDDNITFHQAFFRYAAQLRNSQYSINLGGNRAERDGLEDSDGFLAQVDWTSQRGAHRIGFAAVSQLTDTGLGLGGNGLQNGGFRPGDNGFAEIDVVERISLDARYGHDGLCGERCTVDVGVRWDDQEFETSNRDQDRVGASLGLTYRFSRLTTVRANLNYDEIEFASEDRTDDRVGARLRLDWRFARNLSLQLSGFMNERGSSERDADFDEAGAELRLTYTLR